MRPTRLLAGALRWCMHRWKRAPAGRMLRSAGSSPRHALLAVDDGEHAGGVALLPLAPLGAARWKVVKPGGVGGRILARCRIPGKVCPRDFGLPYAVLEKCSHRWFFGPDDDLGTFLRQ
jgi:hypothetical protein